MESTLNFIERNPQQKIIAVGGGKGGVGKSLVSSSLAISLARLNKSTVLIDLDLGSANLHTCLGLPHSQNSLSDFLQNRVPSFESLQMQSPLPKLKFIGGGNDNLDMADIESSDMQRLLQGVSSLKEDFVVLDLGAGTNDKTLDFFLLANNRIVTVVPEPTSIENAYRFMKSAFYRQIKHLESNHQITHLINEAMDQKNQLGIKSPSDLLRHIQMADPLNGSTFVQKLKQFHMNILVNQTRTHDDRELGKSITSVCRQYFGINVDYMGYLDHDNAAWQALRKKRPLVIDYPNSPVASQIHCIARSLVDPYPTLKAVV